LAILGSKPGKTPKNPQKGVKNPKKWFKTPKLEKSLKGRLGFFGPWGGHVSLVKYG